MEDITFSPVFLGAVPVVIGLVQLMKNFVDARWASLVAVFLGIGVAVLVSNEPWKPTVMGGLVIGLMASGLYSGVRAAVRYPQGEVKSK
jgi:uncharacterized membrane protein HdeD (DUF308 family)